MKSFHIKFRVIDANAPKGSMFANGVCNAGIYALDSAPDAIATAAVLAIVIVVFVFQVFVFVDLKQL